MAFAETFKALSDPVRRRILELLKNERLSAGEIGSHFDMTGATISYHLGILKKAGLVLEFREKNIIYYERDNKLIPISNNNNNPYAIEFRNKLAYVALSRASKKAIILL